MAITPFAHPKYWGQRSVFLSVGCVCRRADGDINDINNIPGTFKLFSVLDTTQLER